MASATLFLDVPILSLNQSLLASELCILWSVLSFFIRCDVAGVIRGGKLDLCLLRLGVNFVIASSNQ